MKERSEVFPKYFYTLLSEFSVDAYRASLKLEDKRLTRAEKQIVESYLLLRDNKLDKAWDLLCSIRSSNPYVEAQLHLAKGILLVSLEKGDLAQEHLGESLSFFLKEKFFYFAFTAAFNGLISAHNFSNKVAAGRFWKSLESLGPEIQEAHRFKLSWGEFLWLSMNEDKEKADRIFEKLYSQNTLEPVWPNFLISAFNHFIAHDELERGAEILERLKSERKFHRSENYIYMKTLLSFLNQDKTIYFYDYKISSPFLKGQLEILDSLARLEKTEAEKRWEVLRNRYPKLYGKDFKYLGRKCLFSLCVEKLLSKQLSQKIVMPTGTQDEKLNKLFAQLDGKPVPKALVYEVLWGAPPESKFDLEKLSKVMSYYKRKYHLDLKSKKGCYILFLGNSKSKAS